MTERREVAEGQIVYVAEEEETGIDGYSTIPEFPKGWKRVGTTDVARIMLARGISRREAVGVLNFHNCLGQR